MPLQFVQASLDVLDHGNFRDGVQLSSRTRTWTLHHSSMQLRAEGSAVTVPSACLVIRPVNDQGQG